MELFDVDLMVNSKHMKFLNEVIGDRNNRCLNFEYIEEGVIDNIKILIEGEKNIEIFIMCQNICKNLEIPDHIMINILKETGEICIKLKEKILIARRDITVNLDTMNINNSIYDKYSDVEKTTYILNLYNQVKIDKREYNNYPNKLIMFGPQGKDVAERINKLELGKIRRTRGGYLIEFINRIENTSNIFSTKFAKGLNEVGIPCLSMPLIAIDYFWE